MKSKQRIASVLPKYSINLDMNTIFAHDADVSDQKSYEKVSSSSGLMAKGYSKLTSPFSDSNQPSFIITPR